MFVGYLNKAYFEIFEITFKNKDEISNIIKIDISATRGIKNLFKKKILLIAKELCLHVKKKYPPASKTDIQKAVAIDIYDIFPIKKPAYHLKINQNQAYTMVDIWGWDSSITEEIKEKFQFVEAIPEEACFTANKTEISVFIENELMYAIAYGNKGFLGSSISKRIEYQQLQNLLRIARLDSSDLGQIRVYSDRSIKLQDLPTELLPKVVYKTTKDYPIAIEYVSKITTRQFALDMLKVKVPTQREVFFRVPIYILSGYLLSLLISGYYYDRATNKLKQEIAVINSKLSNISKKSDDINRQDIADEINKKLMDSVSPLDFMNLLAQNLPPKNFIKKIAITEKNIEIQLVTEQPLEVIKILNELDEIESVKVKGSINKDQKNQYNLTLVLIMA
ncbi:MAG: hypothetical protein N2738_02915 [Thermodesulfovibrionales bacterium]|nr:hypothetical protein [Thermodesulfovibrionales bacterium]